MTRAEELIAQGWRLQGTYDEPRLSEVAATYREIGMEVHLELFHPEEATGCVNCLAEFPERYQTIYIRKREGSS